MRPNMSRAPRLMLCLATLAATSSAIALVQSSSSTDDLRLYYSGNGLLSRGLYDMAIDEYRAFLDAHPDNAKVPVAQYGLSVALHRTKQYKQATPILEDLYTIPDFEFAPQVALLLGQSLIAQKQFAQAVEPLLHMAQQYSDVKGADVAASLACESLFRSGQLEELDAASAMLEQQWPQSDALSRARYFHGLSLMHRQQFERAAERFETLIDNDDDGPYTNQSRLLLASSLEQSGSFQSALRAYRRVLESGVEQLTPDALLGAAAVLLRLDDPQQAALALDTYLDSNADHAQRGHALHLRGRAAFELGHYLEALDLFDDAQEQNAPPTDHAAYWAAKSALRANRNDDAARRLTSILRDSTNDTEILPLVLYDHAVAATRADRTDDALDSIQTLLDNYPDHELAPQALQLQATTLHQLNNYAASQRATDAFLRDYTWHPLAESVSFLAAENRFLLDNYDDAVDAYESFLHDYPDAAQAQAAQFRLGDALYRLGRHDDAARELRLIAQLDDIPDEFQTSLWMLGQLAFDDEQYELATQYFSRYLDQTPAAHAPDDAMLKLGIAQQRLGNNTQSIKTFTDLLDTYPNSELTLHARFERGQSSLEQEAFNAASVDFLAVLDQDPNSRFAPYARNHLGSIAQRAGDFETASEFFEQISSDAPDAISAQAKLRQGQSLLAAQHYDKALDSFDDFLRNHSDSANALTAQAQRAIAMARLENHAAALTALDEALQNTSTLDTPLVHSLMHERVRTLRALDQQDEALDAARELLSERPDNPLRQYIIVDLAQLESAAGNNAGAAILLEQSRPSLAQLADDDSRSLYTQATYIHAVAEYNMEQYDRAAELFGEFLDLGPTDESLVLETMLLRGECLLAIGKHREASDVLEQVTQRTSEDSILAPALLRLGESRAVLQQWDQSEQAFTRFLDSFSEHELWYQARFGIGWANENMGRYDNAIASYQIVAEQHQGPTAARAQFQIGESLFAQDLHEQAIREFLRVDVLYDYPEWSAAALYEAGQCFIALRRLPEARDQFERVVENHADTRWGPLAQQRLDTMPKTPALPGR